MHLEKLDDDNSGYQYLMPFYINKGKMICVAKLYQYPV